MKNNRATVDALKRFQQFTRDYTPYMCAMFCLTLKHNTELSNEDIGYLIDCLQEEHTRYTEKGLSYKEIIDICSEECGLDLYAEVDKAKVNANG